MNARSMRLTLLVSLAALGMAAQVSFAQQAPAPDMKGHDMKQHEMMHKEAAGDAPHKMEPDHRQAIAVTSEERDMVLAEMRVFLESIEGILEAVNSGKPATAAEPARRSGMLATQHMPRAMMQKLPPEFRMLGMETHKKFDAIAQEAQQLADKDGILKGVGSVLTNCTTCHKGYRLVTP